MNERDKTAQMMQDSAGNSWGTEAHFQAFADLIRADTMEAAKIALLGADKALSDRVVKAIRARGNT